MALRFLTEMAAIEEVGISLVGWLRGKKWGLSYIFDKSPNFFLQTFFVAFTVFGHIQSKYEVVPLVRSIFLKIDHDKGETFRPTKIEKRLLLYLILAAPASNFYHGFYNTSGIFCL